MYNINKATTQNPASPSQLVSHHEAGQYARVEGVIFIPPMTPAAHSECDGGCAHEHEHHVVQVDRSGHVARSFAMTTRALKDAVLAGEADELSVVDYDPDTGEAAIICPNCAVGLPCRDTVL